MKRMRMHATDVRAGDFTADMRLVVSAKLMPPRGGAGPKRVGFRRANGRLDTVERGATVTIYRKDPDV